MRTLILVIFAGIFVWLGCEEDEIPIKNERDTEPPQVELTAPVNGTSFSVPAVIMIEVAATDNDRVAYVDFFIDDSPHDSDSIYPYESAWSATKLTPLGTHSILARAYDQSNNVGESEEITVNIRQ
jgi:hypothetical protein